MLRVTPYLCVAMRVNGIVHRPAAGRVTPCEGLVCALGALALVGTSIAQAFCKRRLPLTLGGAAGLSLMVLAASQMRWRRLNDTTPWVKALEEPSPGSPPPEATAQVMRLLQLPIPAPNAQLMHEGRALRLSQVLSGDLQRVTGYLTLVGGPTLDLRAPGQPALKFSQIHQALTEWMGDDQAWVQPLESCLSQEYYGIISQILNTLQWARGINQPLQHHDTRPRQFVLTRHVDADGKLSVLVKVTMTIRLGTPQGQAVSGELGASFNARLVAQPSFHLTEPQLQLFDSEQRLLWQRTYGADGLPKL
jgi:hypothetical protein